MSCCFDAAMLIIPTQVQVTCLIVPFQIGADIFCDTGLDAGTINADEFAKLKAKARA